MLHYDLDWKQLRGVADELQASERQFKAALSRACNRTAATLRKLSLKGLRSELELRTISALRKRLKSIRLRSGKTGMQLWYGLNDLPVSSFKGTPKQLSGGAMSRDFYHQGGFVEKSRKKGRMTIFKRKGTGRLPITEQLNTIKDKSEIYIEDNIFHKVEEIFWNHFIRDIKARVKYNLVTSDRWK